MPDRNLRGAAVESRCQPPSTLIAHLDQRAGRSFGGPDEVGAVDPGMSAAQAGCAAVIDGDYGNRVGQGGPVESKGPIVREWVVAAKGHGRGCSAASFWAGLNSHATAGVKTGADLKLLF